MSLLCAAAESAAQDTVPFDAQGRRDTLRVDQLDWEDLAWRKGDYRIVPYGIGWLNTAFESTRSNPGPFTLYVFSSEVEDNPGFHISARGTRIGLDFAGPPLDQYRYGGRVEVDFYGSAQTENRSGVLLRHAYGEFVTPEWRLLGGQTNDVISPLNPGTLNFTVGWSAGNIGYRRAQLRAERYFDLDDARRMTLQMALERSIVADFTSDQELSGHDAGWPTVMGRWAWEVRQAGGWTAVAGVSGHVGAELVDFLTPPVESNRYFLSWSVNADWRFEVAERWGIQAELFWGQVLGTYLGGISQGIDLERRLPIRSRGGWCEVWWRWAPQWESHVGGGIDDPLDSSLSSGRRSRNQFAFANLIFRVTDLLDVGLECSYWHTQYVDLPSGESARIESVVRYRF